jgi:hypothetical protein
MRKHGIGPAGQDRRYIQRLLRTGHVPNRVDALAQSMKSPRFHPAMRSAPPNAKPFKLPQRNHPMLPPRNLTNLAIRGEQRPMGR